MSDFRPARTRVKCYRQPNRLLLGVGLVLAAVGLLLLFLCIPGWAWTALAGVVLVAGGVVLIRMATGR